MPSVKPLTVRAAFGKELASVLLLAAHPDEMYDNRGVPRADCRTLVLKLQRNEAVFHEQLPVPLVSGRYSASGMAYCGAIRRETIHTWEAGRWSEEKFATNPVDSVNDVLVIQGNSFKEDVIFLTTVDRIFVRQFGKWTSKRLPGEGFPHQIDGNRADEVYIGGSSLLMWNGKALVELEPPEDDGIRGLTISADDRLVGGDTYVSISTGEGGWERIDTPVNDFYSFARFKEHVYALSTDAGVLRVYPGTPAVVTSPLDATGLVAVNDGLIAIGDDAVFVFDGRAWTKIKIPSCKVGKLPV